MAETMRAIKEKQETPDIKNKAYHMLQKQYVQSSMRLKFRKGNELVHNEEFEGQIYKYDLPIVNQPIQFRNALMVIDNEEEAKTPFMNLYEELGMDKDSSFEQFMIRTNQEFNNEIDMYGDLKKAGLADAKLLQFGVPIPYEHFNDKQLMSDLRLNYIPNADMPGAIENVHPNKFIANLRPVEDFRHTPIIPLSDKELSDFQKKRDALNRQGYFVEIKKETIYYYTIFAFLFMTIGYVFYISNEKSQSAQFKMDKYKISKQTAAFGSQGVALLEERRENKAPGT